NPKPQTPNPKPKTQNPKPQTPNPKPQIPNPKLQTPNPEPQTPKPKHQTPNNITHRTSKPILAILTPEPGRELGLEPRTESALNVLLKKTKHRQTLTVCSKN
ncbi:hypothetical protein T484DRAFT_1643583, partial [Baffinella frigidus]